MRRGQALIVVLMLLAVATAVGLSVITRTSTEVSISTGQEESATALSAAEAGIEAKLANIASGTGVDTPVGTSASYQIVSATNQGNRGDKLSNRDLTSGESMTLFLTTDPQNGLPLTSVNNPYNGNLDICWGDLDKANTEIPALELLLYYQDVSDVVTPFKVSRLAYDVNTRGGFVSTGIVTPPTNNSCPSGRNYKYSLKNIRKNDFPAVDTNDRWILLRLRPYYNSTISHPVAVKTNNGNNDLPVQGETIVVEGKAGSSVRKIQVTKEYPDPLSIFDNVLFSGSNL